MISAWTVVAEGAETDSDAVELYQLGCEYAQGFAFGEPMDADAAMRLLTKSGWSGELKSGVDAAWRTAPLHYRSSYSAKAEYPVRCAFRFYHKRLDTGSPRSRAMTAEGNTRPRSRGAMRTRFAKNCPSKDRGAGNAGRAIAPAASRAK